MKKTTKGRKILVIATVITIVIALMAYQVFASAQTFEEHMRIQKLVENTATSTVSLPCEVDTDTSTDTTTNTATDATTDTITDTTTDTSTDASTDETTEATTDTTTETTTDTSTVTVAETEAGYTSYELDLLARVVYCEANVWPNEETGNWERCSDVWQQFVANVVINRVNRPDYPSSIEGVIYDDGQYESANSLYNISSDTEEYQRAYGNAKLVLDGYNPLPKDVVFQAQFPQGYEVYAKIGNTYFCYG